ncbi:Os12g0579450 [Oryza sativa Japonica Group]|uniref:Os12g0579450 protein n=2 Tax=Oryza TaxID=4527 RepID=A0A0P0YC96_ORYSJ|nr:hypothetical protein EE612_060501 [Oryza sativa]KAF2908504.1 hypothetical protein DAI22_12g188800 [Oryza sativa Japonica Group]BAT17806.1 Os12g0579450 [Oryza sativa Japonica Group]
MQLPCAGDQRRRPSGKLAACGTSKLNGGRGGASRLEVDDAGEAITSWTSLHVRIAFGCNRTRPKEICRGRDTGGKLAGKPTRKLATRSITWPARANHLLPPRMYTSARSSPRRSVS